jgi:hypothetical protein
MEADAPKDAKQQPGMGVIAQDVEKVFLHADIVMLGRLAQAVSHLRTVLLPA